MATAQCATRCAGPSRREVPGRPLIYATTPAFLTHFGLASRRDLPGLEDLKAAGLLDPVDLALEGALATDDGEEGDDHSSDETDSLLEKPGEGD